MCVCTKRRGDQERKICVCKSTGRKSVRKVLTMIWEVSTASRRYARMEWDDDDGDGVDDDDDASATTSSK